MREKENRVSMQTHFQPYIDAVHNMETCADVNIDGHIIHLSAHTEISMVDGNPFSFKLSVISNIGIWYWQVFTVGLFYLVQTLRYAFQVIVLLTNSHYIWYTSKFL